jgi:hypothetical protein
MNFEQMITFSIGDINNAKYHKMMADHHDKQGHSFMAKSPDVARNHFRAANLNRIAANHIESGSPDASKHADAAHYENAMVGD